MPLLTTDPIVSRFLSVNGYDTNVNLLIVAEKYPARQLNSYFYRSLFAGYVPSHLQSFFSALCTAFNVPLGAENNMLNNFLAGNQYGKRLLIDALPNGTPPVHPIPTRRLYDLINDITSINPNYIMILHNRNIQTANALIADPMFGHFLPKLLINPNATVHPNIFPFPSAPANPNNFLKSLFALKQAGFSI